MRPLIIRSASNGSTGGSMRAYFRFSLLAALVGTVSAFGSSCGSSTGPRVCTLIGCESGLVVKIGGSLPDSVTVSVSSPGSSQPWTVRCTTAECVQNIFFADFTPTSVHVEVHGPGVDIARDIEPSYVLFQPNGAACPPTCRIATVQLQVG